MSQQIIAREPGDTFLVIRASYVKLCNGNIVAAALIHIFEQWHISKLSAKEQAKRDNDIAERFGDQRTQSENLYQWHTSESLEAALMGMAKRDTILQARKQLVSMGVISEHRNPNPKYSFDKTTYFLFDPDVVNQLLALSVGKSSNERPENRQQSAENRQPSPKNRYYNIDSSIDSTKNNITPPKTSEGPKKSVKEKKVVEKDPPRAHWQKLVDAWFDFYKAKHNGEEPNFTRRNPKLFGELIDLLSARAKKKGKDWTEEHAVASLNFFLGLAYSETWLANHFLLVNLVQQFDAVFGREAVRSQISKPKPVNGTPGFAEELTYITERYCEGALDERLITPDIYDKMTGRNYITVGAMERFQAGTIEEKKILAVKDWLRTFKELKNKKQ